MKDNINKYHVWAQKKTAADPTETRYARSARAATRERGAASRGRVSPPLLVLCAHPLIRVSDSVSYTHLTLPTILRV